MGNYDTAQVCLYGHIITQAAESSPQLQKKYCKKCGQPTIMECQGCGKKIQGKYHTRGVLVVSSKTPPPPNFCHECGKPYPWTETRIQAAKELADELDELSDDEKEKLKKSLDEMAQDSAIAEVAGTRFKKIMSKVGKESYAAMIKVVTDILSETAKKTLFGD